MGQNKLHQNKLGQNKLGAVAGGASLVGDIRGAQLALLSLTHPEGN